MPVDLRGCKRDFEARDRDEIKTCGFQSETRPRDLLFCVPDETETVTDRDKDVFTHKSIYSRLCQPTNF